MPADTFEQRDKLNKMAASVESLTRQSEAIKNQASASLAQYVSVRAAIVADKDFSPADLESFDNRIRRFILLADGFSAATHAALDPLVA